MKELLGFAVLAWPLTLMVIILIAFVVVTSLFAANAARKGKSAWGWGLLGFLLVFLSIFWDWIPTVVAHKYYCSTEAGFWVYKTPEQWKKENPGVMETLKTQKVWQHDYADGKDIVHMNQRFDLVYKKESELFLHRWRWQRRLVDVKTKEILGQYVDFSTGNGNIGGEPELRFWLHRDFCSDGENKAIKFGEFYLQFKGVEE